MQTTKARFSADNLSVFERHGATATQREPGYPGCWVKFPNGWTLSIQWGGGMYGSNRDEQIGSHDVPDAIEAEIAAWPSDHDGLVRWSDGDTVQGWCSMDRVQSVIDLIAEGKLMRDPDPESVEKVADDGWQDPR
jgi:hypothetical protein